MPQMWWNGNNIYSGQEIDSGVFKAEDQSMLQLLGPRDYKEKCSMPKLQSVIEFWRRHANCLSDVR